MRCFPAIIIEPVREPVQLELLILRSALRSLFPETPYGFLMTSLPLQGLLKEINGIKIGNRGLLLG